MGGNHTYKGIDKSEKGTCNVPLRFIHDLESYQKPIQELMEIHKIYCIKGKVSS